MGPLDVEGSGFPLDNAVDASQETKGSSSRRPWRQGRQERRPRPRLASHARRAQRSSAPGSNGPMAQEEKETKQNPNGARGALNAHDAAHYLGFRDGRVMDELPIRRVDLAKPGAA